MSNLQSICSPFVSFHIRTSPFLIFLFFFFNDTATTEIYTLSLHDALPISSTTASARPTKQRLRRPSRRRSGSWVPTSIRSEEHTSELQSQFHLVCRLLLEKKKKQKKHK